MKMEWIFLPRMHAMLIERAVANFECIGAFCIGQYRLCVYSFIFQPIVSHIHRDLAPPSRLLVA